MELSEHLFRHEAGRMVATLTRIFGVHNLGLAEDVVQEAFCRALEIWKFRGVPENPSAWLMLTAKHCALDALRRERTARTFAPELTRQLESEWTLAPTVEEAFGPAAIEDDELRMMFSCCSPHLAEEAQVPLILNILCGFSVDEIASAFVSSHAAIEKRITRSKKVLARSRKLFDVSGAADFARRLPAVQRALYLLFNEGYHGASPESAVRADLCRESMRLAAMLLKNPLGARPSTYALAALMHLNAARLPARLNGSGHLTALADQDRSLFDRGLTREGQRLLEQSAAGDEVSDYHFEAAIAWLHTSAERTEDTDWGAIIGFYDQLMAVRPSPVVALNRAIAIGQQEGPERGLEAIRAIEDAGRLARYPFYHAAMGELELRSRKKEAARGHFATALGLARNAMEQDFFEGRMGECG
jgi:RNA polymerase sigma factor (sigma-70 family)